MTLRIKLSLSLFITLASATYCYADTRIVIQPTIVIDQHEPDIIEVEEHHHRRHRHYVQEGDIEVRWLNSRTVRVSHPDLGWSGKWNYVCFNGNCYPGTRRHGMYYRDFAASHNSFTTEFKVQDDDTGQYITQGGGDL